jgi:FtsZ-binding cell division protein ZapB
MPVTRRRAVSPEQVQALTDTIAALQADYARLDRANADLKAERDLRKQERYLLKQERDLLKHKIKFLQVTVSILLASSAGLGTGLAISVAGYTAEIALTIATTVSLGVIMASMTILNFLRR